MKDDIVALLRVWIDQASQQGVEEAVKGLTMAVDTIERLDAKAFALEYENELLRAEVERLRAGGCARGQTTTQFCAEAEQLRSERDEARRRVCTMSLQLGQVYRRVGGETVRVMTPEAVADMMGWRCFDDIAARCGSGGAGAHTAGPTETFIPEAL